MRRTLIVGALLTAATVAGCGSTPAPTAAVQTTTAAPQTTTAVPVTTAAPPPAQPLGTPQVHEHGETITVHGVQDPAVLNRRMFEDLGPGMRWVVADVEVCASPLSIELPSRSEDFELRTETNRAWAPNLVDHAVDPEFSVGPTSDGDCIRGWVTYQVASAESVNYVVFGRNNPLTWDVIPG